MILIGCFHLHIAAMVDVFNHYFNNNSLVDVSEVENVKEGMIHILHYQMNYKSMKYVGMCVEDVHIYGLTALYELQARAIHLCLSPTITSHLRQSF